MTAWRAQLAGGSGRRPLLIEGDAAAPRGALVSALRSVGHTIDYVYVDGHRWTTSDTEPLALRNGSLISEAGTAAGTVAPGTYLVAVGGPASGRAHLLEPGYPAVIGRAPDDPGRPSPDLAVDDPLLSNRHFAVEADADGGVRVSDLGSKNGTVVEGALLNDSGAATALEPGGLVHAGASLFTAVTLGPDEHATLLGTTPTGLHIHRQFREAVAELSDPPAAPNPPRDVSAGMGMTWWRSLLPLATAGGMALVTGRWWFLLIGALSPIVFAFDAVRRKRKQRRDQETEQARYATELAQHQARLATYRNTEVRRARQRHPGGGAAALAARFRHRRVWERRPADADFGSVTLGFAALPSSYESRDEKQAGTRPDLWQAPLTIDLTVEGPLGITGPMNRAAAVARALLIDLVFAHAPVEVNAWVLTDEPRAPEWEFVQWLPHAFTPDGGARLAATPAGRSALVQGLRGLIETRREQAAGSRAEASMLPLQVVVIDGVDCLAAADLTEILRHGPDVGVIGIVTDPSIVPEGIRGEVQLGRFDDECAYRSVATPRVDDVTVAQLSTQLAGEAALALAPLEAFGAGTAREISQVYFTELVGFGDRSPDEQVEFWAQHSPRTNVPVGVTMDGSPFTIDFVRNGPHGLIGGMTRSGKTEFLKTWFSSLAMYNHPDDLAIAIVDFKGGVDHKTTATLPHVIALATNQNIDVFERTITLLTAEHERREHIFLETAGVATIEGYQTARQSRPELPPIPRLLVVVDEFAELLDTPEGKAQVGRLESVTRIGAGLGVHLLLLTQMFNTALPPTIDGQAGLRVCFKVQNGENSKIVLKSAAAAAISSATKGRAIARFQGGDLIEFQAARVGNEARHRLAGASRPAASSAGDLAVHFATIDSLTRPPAAPEHREVPNEDQDLYHVVDVMRRAARVAGFHADDGHQVVPWPSDLAPDLELADAPDGAIGLADDPERQRVLPLRHGFADAVVAYAGVSGTGHHGALSTTAARLALDHSPDDLHIYGIDLVGEGLALIGGLPHVGAVATRDDATALRIVAHLTTEAAQRRGAIARAGAADYESLVLQGGLVMPRVVLFVLGVDRMFLHGEGTSSPLLAPMTTLVNEVAGTGIQIVFSGSHAVLGNRIGSTASRRLIFGANDPMEFPPAVPRPLRSQLDVPRRCFDTATGLLGQVARLAPDGVNAGDVYTALGDALLERHGEPERPPRRFTKAPWPLQMSDVRAADLAAPPAGIEVGLPLGVRPDTGELMWLDPTEDGTGYRIIGPPKSGRSNALAAIGLLAKRCGWGLVVASASRRSPLVTMEQFASDLVGVDSIPDLVGNGVRRPTLVLVDDAHRIDDEFPWKKLATAESGPLVTFVAGSTEVLTKSIGIMRSLNAPGGVALAPSRSRDADGIGIRQIDDDWLVQPLAGVGVAGIAGEAHRIQFPLVVPLA